MSTHSTEWRPHFALDLRTARPKNLADLVTDFERWLMTNAAQGPLEIANGWHRITPQMSEELLKRNPPGANRKLVHAAVLYYAGQMQRADWAKTGQPIIFTTKGELLDGQHRLWASYLSGASFDSYVITDVEPREDLFAYVDNGKARSLADALATAGMNGLSGLMAQVLKIVEVYDADGFSMHRVLRLPRLSPVEMLHFAREHPRVEEAAHLVVSDYSEAAKVIGSKQVAAFMALKLLEMHDESVLSDFMGEIGTPNDDDDSVIQMFQILMKNDRDPKKKKERMKSHIVLAHLIRTFNVWYTEEPIKKLQLTVTQPFPQIIEKVPLADAAE